MNAIGLDIGASTIKVVWLEKENDLVRFKSSIIGTTPARGMLSESSLDQEEVAQTIRKMIIDAKIPLKTVNLALPDNQVFTKVIDMPLLSDKELSSAIYWEAEQHIPVPLQSIKLDWEVLRKDNVHVQSPKMQVLLVGATIHLLKRYQDVFELSGINISSIETEIISAARAIVSTDNFPTSMIISIGSLGTSIAIVQQGTVVFIYTIPLGGAAMNRAIANEFGFTPVQAEEYKKTYGMDENNFGGKIKQVVEPIVLSLITEIKKALSFYSDKYKDAYPVNQVVLTGGTAKLPGMIPIFVQHIGIETVIANPWKTHAIQHVPQPLMDQGPEYAIAIGLALKEI